MKTPEEMAEEYVAHNRSYPYDPLNAQDRYMRNSYLVGYKAGCENTQTQLAVGEKTIRELLGKPQWISVKDRLPEMNELCIVNTEWRGVVPATYGNESWIFDDGQGWSEKALSYASYWMELPAPPKEEKLITSLDQIHRPQKRISVEEAREMFPDKPPKEEA